MASSTPLRVIVIQGRAQTLSTALEEGIAKDKTAEVAVRRMIFPAKRDFLRGKVVVFNGRGTRDAAGLAAQAKQKNVAAWFIHLEAPAGEAGVDKPVERDTSNFAKILTVKSEADVTAVTAQIREELFGKNAAPIVVSPPLPRSSGRLSIQGEFAGDASVDALRKAFETFGKVQDVRLRAPGQCVVMFEETEAVTRALEKKEIAVGAVKVMVSTIPARKREPKKKTTPSSTGAAAGAAASKGRAAPSSNHVPHVFMKIVDLPEGVDAKALKKIFSGFDSRVNVDVNVDRQHAIVQFESPEAAQKVLKGKFQTETGAELKIQPYEPKGRKPASAGNGKKANGGAARISKSVSHTLKLEKCDLEKCTKEQLEKLFGGFQGFKKVIISQSNGVFVSYDNEESVQEILGSKSITCSGVKLTISKAEPRTPSSSSSGTRQPRPPREPRPPIVPENGIAIRNAPKDANLVELFSAFDPTVKVSQRRDGTAFVDFSSSSIRDEVLKKQIKVGETLLVMEPRRKPIEFGVFIRNATQEKEKQVRELLKPFGEITEVQASARAIKVGFVSPQAVDAVVKAQLTLDGAPLVIEALRQRN